jgi:uncharacterized protein YndB with AHSA1/START domain
MAGGPRRAHRRHGSVALGLARHSIHTRRRWWGPNGFTTTIYEMDVRPGGVWRHTMHGPDGTDYPNNSVFTEIVNHERIVYSHTGGKKGDEIGAPSTVSWTFEETPDGKTRLTLRMLFPSAAIRDHVVNTYRAIEGGKQTLERLAEHLPTVSKGSLRTGRVISTLIVLFLAFDGAAKVMRIAPVRQAFVQLGFAESAILPIGVLLLVCTALYAIPQTSILGAILLAAYLGGATVTHIHAGQPFYFPVVFGLLVWLGLYLRDARLRALIPLRSAEKE